MSALGPLRRRWKVCFASKAEFQTDPRLLIFNKMTSRQKPPFVSPALPTLVAETPTGDGWLHEIKHDCAARMPGIFEALADLPCQAIYSTNWSARCRIDSGMVRPSAAAVLRLITNSNWVGRSTGRSAGFAPFRIRST